MPAPTQSKPIGYYMGLIGSEYRQSPKFMQWLQSVLLIANDITNCLLSIPDAFDVDLAVGAQIDILLQNRGLSRQVDFEPSGEASPVLDDYTCRILIKATDAQNTWDGTKDSLYDVWESLFPGGRIVIIDGQDMAATVVVTGGFSSIVRDLILNDYIVPRPQSVKYNFVIGNLPMFGFSTANTEFIAGFGAGKWS